MSAPLETPPECQAEVSVEIPWKTVKDVRRKLIDRKAPTAVMPGFRKGRVPRTMLNRIFESEVVSWMVEHMAPGVLTEAVSKGDRDVAFGPILESVRFSEGEPLKLSARFEVFPAFELGEYRRLRIPEIRTEVSEDMVDEYLQRLRRANASYQNLDPRPLESGDVAVVSYSVFAEDGRKVAEEEEARIDVSGADEGSLNSALRGRAPGDEYDVEVPDLAIDGPEPEPPQTLRFRGEVIGLCRRDLPDLDDEFAVDIDSNLSTLAQLRDSVRASIEATIQEDVDRRGEQVALRQLVSSHPMTVPPLYLARRLAHHFEEFRRERGLQPEDSLPEGVVSGLTAREEATVKAERILSRIAFVEDISVQDAEIMQAVERYAQANQITTERAYQDLLKEGRIDAWRAVSLRTQALRLVLREAERVDPKDLPDVSASGETESSSDRRK